VDEAATVANIATVQNEGGRKMSRTTRFYSFEAIIGQQAAEQMPWFNPISLKRNRALHFLKAG
jgi:hypothetical protein